MAWVRLTSPFREFGLRTGALYLVSQTLRRLTPWTALYAYDLMAQPVCAGPTLPPNLARQIRFAELRPGAPELDAMPPPSEVKQARFDQGAVALAVYRTDRYIGYVWFCFDRYLEDEVRCTYQLPKSSPAAFDFDVYVFPQYRLGRAFAGVWHAANQFLRARGVPYSYSRISRFNRASLRSHQHLGARRVGSVTFLRLGRCELMMTSAAPHLSLTWLESQRPCLQLSDAESI